MQPKDEIKERLAIESVIGEYLELKRAGRNYKALSPFTNEKTPSFIVSPEKNIWHDFSTGKGGDIFTFVMEVEGLEFPDALKLLANKAGVDLPEFTPGAKTNQELKKKIHQINQLATKYYQSTLIKSPSALEYLKKRGITKQAIKDFELGYAPDAPQNLLKYLKNKGYSPQELTSAGLLSQKSYDTFRDRIMVPFVSPTGDHLGFTGRQLKAEGGFGPKYLNTPQTLVYNKSNFIFGLNLAKESIRKNNLAVLLEGNFDVITSYQAGLKEVLAASGTAITSQQLRQIQRLTENLTLCLDSDSAGIDATIRTLAVTAPTDLKVSVATIPAPHKDTDELIQKEGLEKWKTVLASAQDAYIWLIEQLASSLDLSIPSNKGPYAKKVLEVISKISNPVTQESYRSYLAQKLDVSMASLQELATSRTKSSYKKPIQKEPKRINSKLQELALTTDRFLSILTLRFSQKKLNAKTKTTLTKLKLLKEHQDTYLKSLLDPETKLKKDQSTYKAQLELIAEQLTEFSDSDTEPDKLLNEQYKKLLTQTNELKLLKLKSQLQELEVAEQSKLLTQIQELQSQKIEDLPL